MLLEGAELYRIAAHDQDTIDKYAKGTPNDWLENNLYAHPKRSYWGPWLLLIIDVVLFGVPGIIMLGLQLVNMPFTAAGVINGLCHAKGYRNFETDDASTNLWPIGLFIAGEELHNNHHAFPTSAKFSMFHRTSGSRSVSRRSMARMPSICGKGRADETPEGPARHPVAHRGGT